MRKVSVGMLTMAAFALVVSSAWAQRGVGDPSGVARWEVRPEVVELSGKVVQVDIEPCENTTGRALVGAHFLMENADGQTLNIHLGPAFQLKSLVEDLDEGTTVKVAGFRTDRMKEGHYVAQQVSFGDQTVTLRDESLRPVWAGAAGAGLGVRGDARGPGPGRGPGWGRGAGYGRNRGGGWGPGYGQGLGRQDR